ncbi:asparagine synthase (glutamine-hydrolyzing) [bacterium]|nr:asparagine synthase (glutamine-hydrolyzing) [bacterium]
MCGILSVLSCAPVDPERLRRAAESLHRRGPDGQGEWLDPSGKVGLAHRRLAIVDPARGQQPLANEDGRIQAVVNGEFYDFRFLRSHLESRGHRFRSDCDSEVVCHLYEEYGLDFVHHLRGEFALLLYDGERRRMVAVRDPFGIKPLCYSCYGPEWWFASKACALWAAGLPRGWCPRAFWQAASTQYTLPDQTLFEGIRQLPPGFMARLEDGQLHLTRYWNPRVEASRPEEFLDRLAGAVEERLPEDLPVALQLSGGIDSAAVVALAARRRSDLRAFTVSFDQESHDEFGLAAEVARRCGVSLERIDLNERRLLELLPEAVVASEGLAVNAHLAAKYALDRAIREAGFKVVLTGEGSDEVLLGYPHFRQELAQDERERRAIALQNPIAAGIMVTTGEGLCLSAVEQLLGRVPYFLRAKAALGARIHGCLKPEFCQAQDAYAAMIGWAPLPPQPLEQTAALWNRSALANYILHTLGDGCEMAHSVEGRLPFLDGRLAVYLAGLPTTCKIHQGREKFILREAVRELLPASVVDRQKQPFMAPPMLGGGLLLDHLQDLSAGEHPFLDGSRLRQRLVHWSRLSPSEQVEWAPALTWVASAYHMDRCLRA